MGHKLSTEAKAANSAADTKTVDLVVIVLPDPADPVTLYFATHDVIVDGQAYVGAIRGLPDITYSAGGNPNGGDFIIQNASNDYGPTFITTERALDGGSVVITRAWKLLDGTWQQRIPSTGEPYELGRGVLRTQPVSDTEIKCVFTDDFSNGSVLIGGKQEAQHCLLDFNVNGNHPLGGMCGWLLSMGGDPLSCDHTVDGPNGCKAHGNTRADAIPNLSPTAAATATPSSVSGGLIGSGPGADDTGGYGIHPRKPIEYDPDLRLPFII